MLEKELLLERDLFFLLNGDGNSFWDNVMYIYSFMFTWIPFYLCFFIVFCYKKSWQEILLAFLAVGLVVLLCDQLSSGFAKPFFQRFRPTHHPDFKDQVNIVLGYRGGRYGFFSGHAANSFGFAMLTSLMFRNKAFTVTMFIFAIITAYTRLYLGVHFVSDIVVGAVVGIIVGWLVYELLLLARKLWLKTKPNKLRKGMYSNKSVWFLIIVYLLMVFVILIFNNQIINLFT